MLDILKPKKSIKMEDLVALFNDGVAISIYNENMEKLAYTGSLYYNGKLSIAECFLEAEVLYMEHAKNGYDLYIQ